jgi:hypothetical protein
MMATFLSSRALFAPSLRRCLHRSAAARMSKPPTMKQVEVDEPHVQEELGRIQMDLVKRAERLNADRANKHRHYRKKDWVIGLLCATVACSIYGYTIYAIKQEKFLDDFEMPDPLDETDRSRKG